MPTAADANAQRLGLERMGLIWSISTAMLGINIGRRTEFRSLGSDDEDEDDYQDHEGVN